MTQARIPMVDLSAQYDRIKGAIDAAVAAVVRKTDFVRGEACARFEEDFAAFCGVKHACGVANGTDALRLALWAYGVGPGDEVVTVANTFIATGEAIALNGAIPVFVEVDPDTYTMDPDALEGAITNRTKAILPVHLYGHPCAMDGILAVAARHGLPVLEDAAQAHGAFWREKRVGSIGHAACFSFYPGKNLGAYGDAGAVVSDDSDFIARVRSRANHGGGKDKHDNVVIGTNSRLDTLQAAVLRAKLPHLDRWNAERRERVNRYMVGLSGLPGTGLPTEAASVRSAWHLFTIRVADRQELQQRLSAEGIATAIHYPKPLHLQPAMAAAGARFGSLTTTERLAKEVLSLPLYPELALDAVDRIVTVIRESRAVRRP